MPQKKSKRNPSLRLLKLQSKLRLIANGSSVVNAIRAEHCGCLAVTSGKLLAKVEPQRADDDAPISRAQLPKAHARIHALKKPAADVSANVFIYAHSAQSRRFPGETGRLGRIVTARVPLAGLDRLAEHPEVDFVEAAEGLSLPSPIAQKSGAGAPAVSERQVHGRSEHQDGAGVLVGIIDVGGFDFAHPDFIDAKGKTRFVRVWDQGGNRRPPPRKFNYGAEFTQAHFDAAIAAAAKVGVPPQEIERQSQLAAGSHGTHVASIAGGNRGIARQAVLAGVLVSLAPEESADRRKSFYDSTRIAHAVEYLLQLGRDMKMPVAINVSLGTNGHAHDGSSPISRWIDSALSEPGCALCVAAGNAGQEKAEHANDMGYVLGRIHTSGQLTATGLARDLLWNVVGNGRADISENELEIWYPAQDKFEILVRTPAGQWIGPVQPRQFIENQQLPEGCMLSIYNELYHPANGANYLAVYLSPLMTNGGAVGIPSGTWTVRLRGQEVRDGRYHGWIERDDPRPLGRVGKREYWNFPSFFAESTNVDDSSIGSLACGQRVVAVSNLAAAIERINISSSEGPTRDGRYKPDIAAPGTDIVAANGFAGPDDLWVSYTGTSMASPYACGVAALMLATRPRLTAAQIEAIMRRTAKPLPGAAYAWQKNAGYGVLNPAACVAEAASFELRKDLTP
jgi:subtilisin family serine protease